MEAAGDLITAAAELTAGVEHRIDNLQSRFAGLGLDVNGDTAAVIGDGDGIAFIDDDVDLGAVSGQGFVDGVIHDLIDQMMQTGGRCGTDIHTGTLPNGLETFQHLNLAGVIGFFNFGQNFFRHREPPCNGILTLSWERVARRSRVGCGCAGGDCSASQPPSGASRQLPHRGSQGTCLRRWRGRLQSPQGKARGCLLYFILFSRVTALNWQR